MNIFPNCQEKTTVMTNTILIQHGRVHNGERFLGNCDLLVEDEKVEEIGEIGDVSADQVIDASNCVVSPGFIDAHNMAHQIEQLHRNEAENLTAQGVTTCIIGNCGNSGSFVSADSFLRQIDFLKQAELAINIGNLLGHNSLRQFVLQGATRIATSEEIRMMVSLLEEAMANGALGLSTGLMYSPGIFADQQELIELVSVVGQRGRTYTTHMRDEGDGFYAAVNEALETALHGSARLLISHYKVAGKHNWGKTYETTQIIERRKADQEIYLSFYPYTATSTVLRADIPSDIVQKFSGNYKGLEYTAEDEVIVEKKGLHSLCLNGWRDVIVVTSQAPGIIGKSIEALSQGRSCYHTVINILKSDPNTRVVYHHVADENELFATARLSYAIPVSDGYIYPAGAEEATHPRNYGTFSRVIERYVIDQKLFSLEEFILRATKLPAEIFRLKQRGLLAKGCFADIAIFRPEDIRERADYETPFLLSEGVKHTLVNGRIVFTNGASLSEFPGRYLS